jgi:anti-anti-sigma factor
VGEIEIVIEGDVVHVAGTIDMATAINVTEAAEEVRVEGRPVEIDLRDVAFIDSIGLRELIRLERNGGVRLLNPPERVLHLLDVTGTIELFAVQSPAPGPIAVSERQLCACLSALIEATDARPNRKVEQLLWVATEALATTEVDDLIGALWMIRDFGYLELDTDEEGAVTSLRITDAGRRFVQQTCGSDS